MNNVESASAAGDNYNLRQILLADGLGAVVGSMLGSPFPPAVYIGHPGWKAVGGRIGWWLESVLAPKIYRRVPYVTISDATGREMSGLGIDAERITLVPVGTEPIVQVDTPRSPSPRLVTEGKASSLKWRSMAVSSSSLEAMT